jgi:hypothetical protein
MKTVDTVRTTHKAPPDVAAGTALTEPAPREVPEPTQPDPPKPDPLKPEPAKPDPANPVKPEAGKPTPVRAKAIGSGSRPPGGISLRERGLTRVEAGSTIRATADDGGVAVFRFSFNHAAK